MEHDICLSKIFFNLIILKPQDIAHYNEYSIAQISLVILSIGLALAWAIPVEANHVLISYGFSLSVNFIMFFIAVAFLQW